MHRKYSTFPFLLHTVVAYKWFAMIPQLNTAILAGRCHISPISTESTGGRDRLPSLLRLQFDDVCVLLARVHVPESHCAGTCHSGYKAILVQGCNVTYALLHIDL